MTQPSALTVSKVFVAGGMPTITYNPRAQLGLENQVRDYLEERYRILSISGPTKTGKTVLVNNVLKHEDAIFVSGGTIKTASDLWNAVADELGVHTTLESVRQDTDSESREVSGELGVPRIVKVARSGQEGTSTAITDKQSRSRPVEIAARKALRDVDQPLVIDDFHYIPADVQMDIVRSLKDLVFYGVPVIVIAVPHRAYDVVRVEKEMTGRVQQLPIGFWSNDELLGIASQGFSALQLVDEEGLIASRLAAESFASPHLMQDFCLHTVKSSGLRVRQDRPTALQQPIWEYFFKERSSAASKTAFDMLVRGPRQRTDRKARSLKNGLTVDIYGAVLMAIGHTGPLTSISYETLRTAMREVAAEAPPSSSEITRILGEMTKIAREQIEGEPVVDYDASLNTLHISDPYFAFFLRWRVADELAARSEDHRVPTTSGEGSTSVPTESVEASKNEVEAIAAEAIETEIEIESNTLPAKGRSRAKTRISRRKKKKRGQ